MRTLPFLALAAAAVLAACGQKSEPGAGAAPPPAERPIAAHAPATSGGLPLPAPVGGEGDNAIGWAVPAGWVAEKPSSEMRRAQYRVPGSGGDAECVVFYFGPGQGGDPAANVARWMSQFEDPEGAPKTRTLAADGMKVTAIETSGTYL